MAKQSYRTHPASKVARITASANPLDPRPRSLYIGVGGSIVIVNEDATTDTITVFAGQELHIQPYKITTITTAEVSGLYG